MTLDGARIYFEGVKEKNEYDDKIRMIVNSVRSLSPSSEVCMRFLKSGNQYEGLLWGKVSDVPIGVYKKGHSMAHVLDALYKKVKKQGQDIWKMKNRIRPRKRSHLGKHEPMATGL